MKFLQILALATVILSSCGPKRTPGGTYMPDMAYSRAIESYPTLDTAVFTKYEEEAGSKIFYNAKPVPGSLKRGQLMVFHPGADSLGEKASDLVVNPISDSAMTKEKMAEAERLYLIYCGICHGTKLDGAGPVAAKWGGQPAVLTAAKFGVSAYSDGHMFHTITYGKRQMGGYASQLNVEQRWWIVKYIRSKQTPEKPAEADAKATTATPAGTTAPKADTAKAMTKTN
jgi:mono/diheme cytochrome c family protein